MVPRLPDMFLLLLLPSFTPALGAQYEYAQHSLSPYCLVSLAWTILGL